MLVGSTPGGAVYLSPSQSRAQVREHRTASSPPPLLSSPPLLLISSLTCSFLLFSIPLRALPIFFFSPFFSPPFVSHVAVVARASFRCGPSWLHRLLLVPTSTRCPLGTWRHTPMLRSLPSIKTCWGACGRAAVSRLVSRTDDTVT